MTVKIRFGRLALPFGESATTKIFFSRIGLVEEEFSLEYEPLLTIGLIDRTFKRVTYMNIISILLRHRAALTTNPRDEMFALCAIASDANPSPLDIAMD